MNILTALVEGWLAW